MGIVGPRTAPDCSTSRGTAQGRRKQMQRWWSAGRTPRRAGRGPGGRGPQIRGRVSGGEGGGMVHISERGGEVFFWGCQVK